MKRHGKKRGKQQAPQVSGKVVVIGIVLVAVLGLTLMRVIPRYHTIYKGSASLDPFQENYYYDKVNVETEDAVFKVEVEAHKDRTLSAYLFTQEEFNKYYRLRDLGEGSMDEIEPLWSVTGVTSHMEEGIELNYVGEVMFVVSNDKWNQLAVSYHLAVKEP